MRTLSILLMLTILAAGMGPVACSPSVPKARRVFINDRWVLLAAPAEGTPEGELELIRLYVEKQRYGKVESQVKKFLKRYDGHPAREEAMMLAGDARLADERYFQAYEWYEKQLDEYPAGKFSDRALQQEYRIAGDFLAGQKQVIWGFIWLGAEDEGIEILMRIAEHAPMSPLAEDSLLMMGDYYSAEGEYSEAAEAYDNYLELFPKSPRSAYAMFRSAQAVLSMYRGVKYQDTPLVEANLRFHNFADSFPAEAEAMNVAGILNRIAVLRAHEDYNTAQLYERIGKPGPAKFYYGEVTNKYGDNEWSVRASAALKRMDAAKASGKGDG